MQDTNVELAGDSLVGNANTKHFHSSTMCKTYAGALVD
jgi:hypothetical protein